MKKSASVRLTVVAAIGMGAAHGQQRQDPCAAASFKQQACQAAVQNRGYCWDGKWVQLTYHYPYPYYYDAYQQYTTNRGHGERSDCRIVRSSRLGPRGVRSDRRAAWSGRLGT